MLKTNNCFLALCTNFNSCWNWWSPASPQACSPLPFTAGMSLQESPIKAWCLINTDVEKKCLSSSTFFFLNSHRNYEKQKLKKKTKTVYQQQKKLNKRWLSWRTPKYSVWEMYSSLGAKNPSVYYVLLSYSRCNPILYLLELLREQKDTAGIKHQGSMVKNLCDAVWWTYFGKHGNLPSFSSYHS